MAITVRVQNFQSIEDATVVIDGLTVVTGPNNSGKTALMRAVRGVFTNPAADALVRHGKPHLIVTVTFDDGNEVIWKKGWEKTYKKGKRIQSYTVNGKELGKLGKGGVPDEVTALGVRAIKAGNSPIWPQIARQFTGQVFLMDKPGSVMAEAIADVERVGKLGSALKLAEKDKRSAQSDLKVRRKDAIRLEGELAEFEGLDAVSESVDALDQQAADLVSLRVEEAALSVLHERLQAAQSQAEALEGVERVPIPSNQDMAAYTSVQKQAWSLLDLQSRYDSTKAEVDALDGVDSVEVGGDPEEADRLRTEINALGGLSSRLESAQADLTLWEQASAAAAGIDIADTNYPDRIRKAIGIFVDLQRRLLTAADEVGSLEGDLGHATQELEAAEKEVADLLGTLEQCPTCQQPITGGEHVHS